MSDCCYRTAIRPIVQCMAVTHIDTRPTTLSVTVAARIRAALALRGMNQADLARSMGVPALWISRRLSPKSVRPVSLNLDEIEQIALILDMPVPALFAGGAADGNQPVSRRPNLRPNLRLVA